MGWDPRRAPSLVLRWAGVGGGPPGGGTLPPGASAIHRSPAALTAPPGPHPTRSPEAWRCCRLHFPAAPAAALGRCRGDQARSAYRAGSQKALRVRPQRATGQ